MATMNSMNGGALWSRSGRRPGEHARAALEPAGAPASGEERESESAQLPAGFEDAELELRQQSAGRWSMALELGLALDQGLDQGLDEPANDAVQEEPDEPAGAALHALRAAGARPPWKFERKSFYQAYAAAFSKLDERQTEGLNALLTAAEADAELSDLRWLAYMLATVQHECAGTWRPIEEYGKGAGRPYGKPVVVVDPQGKKFRNVYYGRGYVQLTWKSNYEKLGKLLGNRLLYEPKLALQPAVAYRIMSLGMRRGLFTGKKLSDYLREGKTDYVNARRIINALDQAQKLAKNAVRLEKILRSSLVSQASGPAAGLLSSVAAAAGKASAQYHDESKWLSLFEGSPRLSWDKLELNRQAERSQTAEGFNIPVKHEPQLWRWSKGDASTLKWRPQGISGSREAGSAERARWLVVSWYGRKEADNAQRGARISLLDYAPDSPSYLKYRHVLLVQDVANRDDPDLFHLPEGAPAYQQHAGFAPVTVHAGGIAWAGDLLYVADTTLGLRVFDLTRLHPVEADPSGNRCGSEGGAMYGFNYRYVLPQIGYYRMAGTAPHSFVSVGASGEERCLWVGQYLQNATKRTPMLFAWRLQPNGQIDTGAALAELQPNDGGARAYNMQGAYHAAGASWLSVTGRPVYKGSTARLITQAAQAKGVRWRWPHGAEDLYLEADTNTLWCLTEYTAGESPGERFVFGVSLPSYAATLHPSTSK